MVWSPLIWQGGFVNGALQVTVVCWPLNWRVAVMSYRVIACPLGGAAIQVTGIAVGPVSCPLVGEVITALPGSGNGPSGIGCASIRGRASIGGTNASTLGVASIGGTGASIAGGASIGPESGSIALRRAPAAIQWRNFCIHGSAYPSGMTSDWLGRRWTSRRATAVE